MILPFDIKKGYDMDMISVFVGIGIAVGVGIITFLVVVVFILRKKVKLLEEIIDNIYNDIRCESDRLDKDVESLSKEDDLLRNLINNSVIELNDSFNSTIDSRYDKLKNLIDFKQTNIEMIDSQINWYKQVNGIEKLITVKSKIEEIENNLEILNERTKGINPSK